MTTNGELFRPVLQEFPQPSRPFHAYGSNMESQDYEFSDQYFDTLQDFDQEQEKEERYISDDDLLHMLRSFVNKLDKKSHGMLKKLLNKVEKDVPFERLFRETIQDFRGKPVSDMFEKFLSKLHLHMVNHHGCSDRGLDGDSDEFKHKLERFKVKPINVGGVVKEEQK